jgi:hypothetical protein
MPKRPYNSAQGSSTLRHLSNVITYNKYGLLASQYQWEHNIRRGDDCLRRYVEAGFKIGVGAAENCRIGFCVTFRTPQ